MKEVADGSVQLIVTSPPYNVGKDYGENYDDLRKPAEYLDYLDGVWIECMRVLCKGGRLAVNIANKDRKPYYSLSADLTGRLIDMGFKMRGDVIWDKGASAGVSTAWGSWRQASNPTLRDVHEHILIFSKEEWKLESETDHLSTITSDEFCGYTKSIWRMTTANSIGRDHPTPFPIDLPKRLIQLYTYIDDTVLDPFLGSGTTCVAAKSLARKSIGYEINADFKKTIDARIEDTRELSFKPKSIRTNGKPID
jgi:DNA modification methylase